LDTRHSIFSGCAVNVRKQVYGWLVLLEKKDDGDFSEEDEGWHYPRLPGSHCYENAVLTERLQRNAEELDRNWPRATRDEGAVHLARIARTAISAVRRPSIHYYLLDGLAGELNGEQREYWK